MSSSPLPPPSGSSLTPNRRSFIRSTVAAAATAPFILPGRAAEVEKLELGFMGLNSRGAALVKDFLGTGRVIVTWLCDVDQRAVDKVGAMVKETQVRAFRTTANFQHLLEDRRLQGLVIATPDHWHAIATLQALKAGKPVYVEKPLSHNPREGERVVEAQRKTRVPVQVGLQRRSVPWVRSAVQRVQDGELGEVHFARTWYGNRRESIGFGQLAPVPDWLDFALWQGPAPTRPFRDNVVHYNWHWFWHWGTGELGNNGVHFLDLVRWALKLDCPDRVTSAGGRYYFRDDQETPDTQVVTYEFGSTTVVWEHRSCQPSTLEGEDSGVAFYGTKASLVLGSSGYRILDLAGRELARVEGKVPSTPHVSEFLDVVEDRGKVLSAPAEEGHLSTLLCHLGNIAHRTGQALTLNAKTRQLREPGAAARFWSREYDSAWTP